MAQKNLDVSAYDRNMAATEDEKPHLRWHNVDEPGFRLSGFAFRTPGGKFRRFPEFQPGYLPEAVDRLAWHTSGGNLSFITDSSEIALRVKMQYTYRSYHLTLLTCGGFDIYEGSPENRRFIVSGNFPADKTEYTTTLFSDLKRAKREYMLNFPLYGGVESLEIGVDPDAVIEAPSPWKDPRPVIFYGTSITQGACAGRPGLSPVNILGRRWNVPVLNFGFSGSGKGEENVVETIAGAAENPRLFVLDYAANAIKDDILINTLDRAIAIIRRKHPEVPIALPTLSAFSKHELLPKNNLYRSSIDKTNAFIRETAEKYRQAGDSNIIFVNSRLADYYDDWTECCADGLHLNDLGFYRTAELWAEQLKEIIS